MHDAPPWIVLDPARGPTCVRCGAAWERGRLEVLDAFLDATGHVGDSAVLRLLFAFIGEHESCGQGPVYHPVVLEQPGDAAPPPACARCGTAFKFLHYRRCYVCNPCVSVAVGTCLRCGRVFGSRRRCYVCSPTPVLLRFHRGIVKA